MKVIVEADGGSRGNPGPAGYGAVVWSAERDAVLAERNEAIGTATNNVAEYRGLIAGLEAAADVGRPPQAGGGAVLARTISSTGRSVRESVSTLSSRICRSSRG